MSSIGTIASSIHKTSFTAPTSVSGLVAWYDVTDAASVTQIAGLVSQLNDKSGNGYHLVQATGGNQPTYTSTGGANNKAHIIFTSGKTLAKTGVTQGLPYTAYVLLRQNSIVDNGLLLNFHSGAANGLAQKTVSSWSPGGGMGIAMESGYAGSSVFNCYKTDYALFRFTFQSGTGIRQALNKEPDFFSLVSAGAAGMSDIIIGKDTSFDFQEMAIYSGDITGQNDFFIRDYFYKKYTLSNYDNIVFLGDSITAGTGASVSTQTAYAPLTAFGKSKNIYNYAVSGASIYGSTGLQTKLLNANSYNTNGYVVMLYGTNDTINTQWSIDYKYFINQILSFGYSKSKMIIATPNYQTGSASGKVATLPPIIAQIATDTGITACDMWTYTYNNGGASLLNDGTHPNDTGHAAIATYLKTFIT